MLAGTGISIVFASREDWAQQAGLPVIYKSTGAQFTIPADYYQMLGLRSSELYKDSQIKDKIDELSSSQLEIGYSPRVAEGRLSLLASAEAELKAHRGRPPKGEVRALEVDWALLPSALSLLQEVGESELVIEIGNKVLDAWQSAALRRDVLLSMALSNLRIADELLTDNQVLGGCARMQAAKVLLEDGGYPPLAPHLIHDIENYLVDMKPHCVLNHLKLPLGTEHEAVRTQAVEVLQYLLQAPGNGPSVDGIYLRQAISGLTGPEIVNLLDWQQVADSREIADWSYGGLLQTAAIAHIAVGFVQRRPALITAADKILQSLSKEADVVVEQAIAKLLLGAPDDALEMLRRADRRPPASRDPEVPDSLVPVAMIGQVKPLSPFGSSPVVIGLPPRSEALVFVRRESSSPDEDLLPGFLLLTQRWLAKIAFPYFRDLAESPPSCDQRMLDRYFEDNRVTSYVDAQSNQQRSWRKNIMGMAQDLISDAQAQVGGVLHDFPQVLKPPTVTAKPLEEDASEPEHDQEQSSSSSAQEGTLLSNRPMTLLAAGGAVLLLAAAGIAASILPRAASSPAASAEVGVAVSQPAPLTRKQSQKQPLNTRTAEMLVRKWQGTKAAALGPRRDMSRLGGVLAEPMLSAFTKEAAIAQESGWFWRYNLKSIKVNSISEVSNVEALVLATVDESGDLWAENGKQADSYSNPYTVEYTVVKGEDGCWRIKENLVIGKTK